MKALLQVALHLSSYCSGCEAQYLYQHEPAQEPKEAFKPFPAFEKAAFLMLVVGADFATSRSAVCRLAAHFGKISPFRARFLASFFFFTRVPVRDSGRTPYPSTQYRRRYP